MKAKNLIKILEQHPEMEVKIHNGFVNDWQDIDIIEETLEKLKPSIAFQTMVEQHKQHGTPQPKKKPKTNWQYPSPFEEDSDWRRPLYSRKKVFLIQGKPKGKTVSDRIGKMKY